MKKLIPLAAIFLILFFSQTMVSSCSKTDTVVKIVADSSVAERLLGKQWIVDSLFNGYTATTKGTLVYSRGSSNNLQNLDNYIVIMWPDGTQFFANSGSYATYTYTFRSADSLNLLINNTKADYARIVTLDAKHLTIYDSTNSALSYYD